MLRIWKSCGRSCLISQSRSDSDATTPIAGQNTASPLLGDLTSGSASSCNDQFFNDPVKIFPNTSTPSLPSAVPTPTTFAPTAFIRLKPA